MPKFLIMFGANAMDHIPDSEMHDVARDAHGVVQEIINAGVYVMAGGLASQQSSIVAIDGSVTNGTHPNALSGITVVDVQSLELALMWAAKIAVACRCAQEVREIGHDAELEEMLVTRDLHK